MKNKVCINQWFDFCKNDGIDSQTASVKDGLEFLTPLYELNKRYTDCARSILSVFIQADNAVEFGTQKIVQKCMKSIYRLWPYFA